jgi:hypothetical protein
MQPPWRDQTGLVGIGVNLAAAALAFLGVPRVLWVLVLLLGLSLVVYGLGKKTLAQREAVRLRKERQRKGVFPDDLGDRLSIAASLQVGLKCLIAFLRERGQSAPNPGPAQRARAIEEGCDPHRAATGPPEYAEETCLAYLYVYRDAIAEPIKAAFRSGDLTGPEETADIHQGGTVEQMWQAKEAAGRYLRLLEKLP